MYSFICLLQFILCDHCQPDLHLYIRKMLTKGPLIIYLFSLTSQLGGGGACLNCFNKIIKKNPVIALNILCSLLTVPLVDLQSAIVTFPGHVWRLVSPFFLSAFVYTPVLLIFYPVIYVSPSHWCQLRQNDFFMFTHRPS